MFGFKINNPYELPTRTHSHIQEIGVYSNFLKCIPDLVRFGKNKEKKFPPNIFNLKYVVRSEQNKRNNLYNLENPPAFGNQR